jgi:hypothetical protein
MKLCRGDLLNELVTLDITTPEAMTSLLAAHKKGTSIFKTLDILHDAICTDTYVDLAWRAPTKNIQRIEGYKLSMCNQNGLVKTVYEGPSTSCRVADLLPGTEYVFSVKADYSDGSYARSQPACFGTKII